MLARIQFIPGWRFGQAHEPLPPRDFSDTLDSDPRYGAVLALGVASLATEPKTKVSLFVTCIVDQMFPEVGVSVVRLLRSQGVEVYFPNDQTCCGQPVFNSGFANEARYLAKRVLNSFGSTDLERENHYVVVPSGSCATMLRGVLSRPFPARH